ncbi:MAG: hypothetical protein R3E67_02850 [Pseudomonadales bacterium]
MTMGAAQLMIKYGITCNVIMLRARTAMTDQGATAAMFAKPQDGFDVFDPANVAPLVSYPRFAKCRSYFRRSVHRVGGCVSRLCSVQLSIHTTTTRKVASGRKMACASSLSAYFDANHAPVWGGFSVPPQ